MSNAPPSGDGERGSAVEESPPASPDAAPAASATASGLSGSFERTEATNPEARPAGSTRTAVEEEVALYEDEAGADPADPKRAARLLHEAAHLRERRMGLLREAAKTYTRSLTADPTLQPNTWALCRLFLGRGFWDNLVRLLDAELRFAPLPAASDRADVLVEKGRLLEDRLGREEEARACYRSALELDPTHPAALLALWSAALRAGVQAEVVQALTGLAARVAEPEARALLTVELARAQRGPVHDGSAP